MRTGIESKCGLLVLPKRGSTAVAFAREVTSCAASTRADAGAGTGVASSLAVASAVE